MNEMSFPRRASEEELLPAGDQRSTKDSHRVFFFIYIFDEIRAVRSRQQSQTLLT